MPPFQYHVSGCRHPRARLRAGIKFEQEPLRAGDRVVVTAGVPLGTPGSTNLLRVAFVGPKTG